MTGRAGLAVVILVGLVGCDRGAVRLAPTHMTDSQLNQELQRCRGLGLKFYDDEDCRKAQQERTRRFYAKSSRPVR